MSYLDLFEKDKPWTAIAAEPMPEDILNGQIDGCHAIRLSPNADDRGHLTELLTTRSGPIDPIVHVYQVVAEPGSVRAWIYHAIQTDRLCFTTGSFRIVLFDLRESSPTYQNRVELIAGARSKIRLTIPPFVAHGVENFGPEAASYLNLPDRVYDLLDPDKHRYPAATLDTGVFTESLCLQS